MNCTCVSAKNYNTLYSYNKSQQDALFLKFILIKDSTCFGQINYPSSGVSKTVYTAIGICHASYVDCLLVRSGPDLTSRQST